MPTAFQNTLATAQKRAAFPYLSRWQFERLLDLIAVGLHEMLSEKLSCNLGCAILYLTRGDRYRVGGSSVNRLTMDPPARFYDLADEKSRRSLTGFAARHSVAFALDKFQESVKRFRPTIEHESKTGELGKGETKSFLAIPSLPSDVVRDGDALPSAPSERLPHSILRFNFSKTGLASEARDFLESQSILGPLFGVIAAGHEKATRNAAEHQALAIADLDADLLRFRNREIDGLDELAFHLQTLFGHCEVSIFTAHKNTTLSTEERRVVDLQLAATTALSGEDPHKSFRKRFFDFKRVKTYRVFVSEPSGAIEPEDNAKTELAFCRYPEPYLKTKLTGSKKFPQQGEIRDCGSFLGLAIPPVHEAHQWSRTANLPYGVIRIVHKDKTAFGEQERRLAVAITQALAYWLDLFPKNENLQVLWESPEQKQVVLNNLFGAESDSLAPADLELELLWLLQKIFVSSKKITIGPMFSGKSEAVVLLVKNDAGLDLILKCARRNSPWGEATGRGHKEILHEVQNYRRFVEGKVRLNHSVIYPDLVRETRRLVGFATSFLGSQSGSLISLTQLCREAQPSYDAQLEWTLTRIIEQSVGDIWGWWYDQSKQIGPHPLEKLLANLLADPLFSFVDNMVKFDSKFAEKLDSLSRRAKMLPFAGQPSELAIPSKIWEAFSSGVKSYATDVVWSETITHGDLHGDNIFCDSTGANVWLIDFARTGRRVAIFDLALLESDLKFRQLPNVLGKDNLDSDFKSDYLEFEKDLASQSHYERLVLPRAGKSEVLNMFAKIITDIRQLSAQRLRRVGPTLDYQMVLFLLALKYMKLRESEGELVLLPYYSALQILEQGFGFQLEPEA